VLRLAAHGLNDQARAGYEANSRGWQKLREALRLLPPEPLIACWEDLVPPRLRDVMPQVDGLACWCMAVAATSIASRSFAGWLSVCRRPRSAFTTKLTIPRT